MRDGVPPRRRKVLRLRSTQSFIPPFSSPISLPRPPAFPPTPIVVVRQELPLHLTCCKLPELASSPREATQREQLQIGFLLRFLYIPLAAPPVP
ncbi:hypothetical protein MLD38_015645 [Melastoma candidum]|uniref:Uncharacterized protein n=1 Tax=Melastoma candidum TaxID=119954 RepID=A0ACB9RGF4_9MYRT|nr:hypothetical protein MLD38_015645 [Melastoma candidum]